MWFWNQIRLKSPKHKVYCFAFFICNVVSSLKCDDQSWRKKWANKEITPEGAISKIISGNRVFIGTGCAAPQTLVETLLGNSNKLSDIEIIHYMTLFPEKYFEGKRSTTFRHNTFFVGGSIRDQVKEGNADYTPMMASQVSQLFRSGRKNIDVALLQASPPDAFGFCSLGFGVGFARDLIPAAHMVIAEINPYVPRTYGDGMVHIKDFDYFVYSERRPLEFTLPEPDKIDMKIAENIASLIRHKSCLHFDFGMISKAVQKYLANSEPKHDLGIHSFIISDDLIPLIEKNIVTCRRKTYHPERIVTSIGIGTKKLYEFVDNNPYIEFHIASQVCNPGLIARNNRMVSINQAVSIDLTGQISASFREYQFFTGIGETLDFLRGSAFSQGGKPIIAVRSTNRSGTKSHIVTQLEAGSSLLISPVDVHYVVTEWGVAYLHGKTIRERALELVNIAHPIFRQDLLEEIKEKKYVFEDQTLHFNVQGEVVPYPKQYETTATTKSGEKVLIRPLKITDEKRLQDLSYSMSSSDRYMRYFAAVPTFEHEKTQKEVAIDYLNQMSIGAFVGEIGSEEMVGNAVYYLDPKTNMAEIAFIVRGDWQKEGIGSLLLSYLTIIARERNIRGFWATFLYQNRTVINILKKVFNNYYLHIEMPEKPGPDEEVYFQVKFEKE